MILIVCKILRLVIMYLRVGYMCQSAGKMSGIQWVPIWDDQEEQMTKIDADENDGMSETPARTCETSN